MKTREITLVRIHVPVAEETLGAMLAGDGAAAERDPVLAQVFGVIRQDNPLGDFGLYTDVAEIAIGWESFRPAAHARPALGEAGKASLSPTVILSLHAPCAPDDPALTAAVDRLLDVHPWEVPVIEIASTVLACRDDL